MSVKAINRIATLSRERFLKEFCVTILFFSIIFCFILIPAVTFGDDNYTKNFEWSYGGLQWTLSTTIPKSLYNSYKRVSVSERVRNGLAGYGFLVTTRDEYVIQVANSLHKAAMQKGYGSYDEVSFILAFVQSLPYTTDSVTTGFDEYPRFPIETLVDDGGDCEDTSILFATIMLILDYDVIFIAPPIHCAVGVLGTDLQGYYWKYNGKTYYFCETTGEGYHIGDLPNDYIDASASLYSINENIQFNPNQNANKFNDILYVIIFCIIVLIMWIVIKREENEKKYGMYENQLIYCPRCGKKNPIGVNYCMACGNKLYIYYT